ncbi:MAG: FtsX-like permease family protein [Clostridia bacterium]|nr:FtsX-like permease family protein [Clostridia bacterium]
MVVGIKDGIKLIGISIVCFCAVFVCTFMLNYYLDVLPLEETLTDSAMTALYNAQLATAKFTSVITGGVLAAIALIMLFFYIKLYIDSHSQQLGIVKAFGYSRGKIAGSFWVFGLSVFIGCALGFCIGWAFMRSIYDDLTIEGMGEIAINFHWELLALLVFIPTAVFTALACLYAYCALRRPVLQLLKGKSERISARKEKDRKERPFLWQMCIKTLSSKKSLVFFVAFSCFCFSAMVQMGLSMENLTSATMGYIILLIGLILAIVTMFMAITTLINGNKKNISVMKAFGYSIKECSLSILGGYAPFALLGFGLGSVYQYGLLKIMINVVFANVESVPEYKFDVPVFFLTLALFAICFLTLMCVYSFKINKISVKEVMIEN